MMEQTPTPPSAVPAARFRPRRGSDDELDLQAELSAALGGDVDRVRLERAGPVLRFHAVFPGKLLWGNRGAFRRLRWRVLKEWQDSRKPLQASLRRP